MSQFTRMKAVEAVSRILQGTGHDPAYACSMAIMFQVFIEEGNDRALAIADGTIDEFDKAEVVPLRRGKSAA